MTRGCYLQDITKQPRAEENKKTVLNQAIELLISRHEAEFRIGDVCELSGLSSSVIYSYFRSREGLIDAAYLELYKLVTSRTEIALHNFLSDSLNPKEFLTNVSKVNSLTNSKSMWADTRNLRLRVCAHAVGCPRFMKSFAPLSNKHFDEIAEIFENLKVKKLIKTKNTAVQCARAYEGFELSWALHEGLNDVDLTHEWIEAYLSFLVAD